MEITVVIVVTYSVVTTYRAADEELPYDPGAVGMAAAVVEGDGLLAVAVG